MTEASVEAFVGLGANLGDAAASVRGAADALAALPGVAELRLSPLYRTPAWGLADQPDFVNGVARLQTTLPARDLLDALLAIEKAAGRDRSTAIQWGPRVLDLDLLLYGDDVVDEPGLHVPHPRMHQRAFVLLPLRDLAPNRVIPGHGAVHALAGIVETAGIEAIR